MLLANPLKFDKKLVVAAIVAALGFSCNLWLPVQGSFGIDFVVGAVLVYAFADFYKDGCHKYFVAFAIFSATFLLWGHPWYFVITFIEFAFVAYRPFKLRTVLSSFLFWIFIGTPLVYITYGLLQGFSFDIWLLILMKQSLNSILCISIGVFVSTIIKIINKADDSVSIVNFVYNAIIPLLLIPVIVISLSHFNEVSRGELDVQARDLSDLVSQVDREINRDRRNAEDAVISARVSSIVRAEYERSGRADVMLRYQIGGRDFAISVCQAGCPPPVAKLNADPLLSRQFSTPGVRLLASQGASPLLKWKNSVLVASVPAHDGMGGIEAASSIEHVVERLLAEARYDFFVLLITLVSLVGLGYIIAQRTLKPLVSMRQELPAYLLSDPQTRQLPIQQFRELDELRQAIETFSGELFVERDRTMELERQLDAIGERSPMIFATWRMHRRFGSPELIIRSEAPESRLRVPGQIIAVPGAAAAFVHPDDRPSVSAMLKALAQTSHAGAEVRVLGLDGDWRWLLVRLSRRINRTGAMEVVGILTDMTDVSSMRTQVGNIDGLMFVNKMVAGLAHELNQPLNVISMAADNIANKVAHSDLDAQENKDYIALKLGKISTQIRRASSILATVEDVAVQSSASRESVDVTELVQTSCDIVANEAKSKQVTIESFSIKNGLCVHINLESMADAISSILRNSVEACGHGERNDRSVQISVVPFSNVSRVKIEISDNGPGFPSEILPFIFSPFTSSKISNAGNGLSLARCFAVIHASGGEVYARNGTNGAVVSIYLPLARCG